VSPEAVVGDGQARDQATRADAVRAHLRAVHPAFWTVALAALIFTVVFGRLAVQNHHNFGTWAFDLSIYDQGTWLLSRGKSFVTVRGLDLWGHHINLILVLFVPFYWFGAGPDFLLVVQAAALGAGAFPVYLLARDRMRNEWVGAVFAVVYLLYAPVEWVTSANFHPEALVVTPLLWAWWFGTRRRWTGTFVALAFALATREDTALAVIVLGAVLWWHLRGDPEAGSSDRRMALAVAGAGVAWYLVATRLVIPWRNYGEEPFYVRGFYGHYGDGMFEVAGEVLTRPDRVVSDGTQPDRLRFYRDLLLPWGGLPLAGLVELLMAGPQMLASVIGTSPYARMIRYQYTSVMLAPITIAAVEGAARLWRFRHVRQVLVPWLLVCAYVSHVAWSPSPISANEAVWATPRERHGAMRAALDLVPDDAAVTATFALSPHIAHREQLYDWPNPWIPAYWGNDDERRLPDPTEIEYLLVDRLHVGADHRPLFDSLIAPGGDYEVVFEADDVIVAQRVD
jgi:uncharacterized membrane protein